MSKNKLRWGIISTARINRRVIPPMRQAARSELVGVASRNLEKATAYAAQWEIPRVYGSYEAMLNDPEIDAVYISLPNTFHFEWAMAAAKAGKHILCEKPLVQTVADFDQLAQTAKENGVHLCEAFAHLHIPQHHRIRELVRNGRIGELRLFEGWFHFYLSPEQASNIRLNADLGGGSLWDLGVYSNALAVFYADGQAPQRVSATKTVSQSGVDELFIGQMQFGTGMTAHINCSFHNPFREGMRLTGTKGLIELARPHNTTDGLPTHVVITNNDNSQETIEIAAKDSYLAEIEAFEATVLDGAAPILPLSTSRNFLQSVLTLHQAAATNTLIQLSRQVE